MPTNQIRRRARRALPLAVAMLSLAGSASAQTTVTSRNDPGLARLEAQFADLAKVTKGTVGAAVIHLESGRVAYLNRGVSFPMASTVKVPLVVQLLSRVDKGEVRLDSMITLQPGDLHPGSGTLTELFNHPGVALSVRNLMELMLRISDNSATDILLRTAGGASAVNARLGTLGVSGVRADRPTVRLIADYMGVKNLPGDDVSITAFNQLYGAVTDAEQRAAVTAFASDPRDTSTPEGMARLLEVVWDGHAMSPASRDLLLDIMYRCLTGNERIKGMLPAGTRVAHKTGTIGPSRMIPGGRTANDVGIIDLPNNGGHLITAVFVKDADDSALAERAIAHIARASYDYFTYAAPAANGVVR
jgi:beta-lactamase class A